nr:immunoglobulin heavy chain junction region [Macaca mulatta]MOX59448.1 immunoglobulin heavy chain junction region [Macaca mulatta]MOX60876.1 immunoglobulin heavy chain junction region [Macaca mulatta]MOX60884.1 immunoglobulin heavy chain junction region [Macaca mulatta]MOX61937.1 immunoglobulin heavy chain junction region [Macaca mulatta]
CARDVFGGGLDYW